MKTSQIIRHVYPSFREVRRKLGINENIVQQYTNNNQGETTVKISNGKGPPADGGRVRVRYRGPHSGACEARLTPRVMVGEIMAALQVTNGSRPGTTGREDQTVLTDRVKG